MLRRKTLQRGALPGRSGRWPSRPFARCARTPGMGRLAGPGPPDRPRVARRDRVAASGDARPARPSQEEPMTHTAEAVPVLAPEDTVSAPPAAPAGNPAVVGVPTFLVGS